MNVEEGMKLLRDPQVWNVELTPRPGVFAKSRPTGWQFATVGFAAVAAVAIITTSAVLLGGLQPAPPPAGPVTTHTPEPSETPTPPPSTEPTGLSAPAPVFDGDCGAFISDETLSTLASATFELVPKFDSDEDGTVGPEKAIYRQLGIITCSWQGATSGVNLTLLRDDVAPGSGRETCGSYESGEASFQENLCVVDAVAHGLRMSGSVSLGSRNESKAAAKRLVEYFEETDPGDAVGVTPVVEPGSWPIPLRCSDFTPLEVDGASIELENFVLGSDSGSLPVEDQIATLYAGDGCVGQVVGSDGTQVDFNFRTVSGGAWQFDAALDTLDAASTPIEAVDFEGFSHGALADEGDVHTYYLVSGPNYLELNVWGPTADDEPLVSAIMAKID